MVAGLVLDRERRAARNQALAVERQMLRRVVKQLVSALLRFKEQGEGRITANVDAVDRVHLAGYFHGNTRAFVAVLCLVAQNLAQARGYGKGWPQDPGPHLT